MTFANLSGRFKLLEHQCSVYDEVNLNAQGGQLVQCCCLNACMLAEEDAAYIMYALCNAAYVMGKSPQIVTVISGGCQIKVTSF